MKPRRSYSRHGLNVVKAQVKVRGLGAIDRRTAAARDLLAWRDELVRDLGGNAEVTAATRALVEAATRTRLYVDHLDAFLMAQGSLVNARRRAVLPVLRERQQLVDSLARLLTTLGLERRKAHVPSLAEYVEHQYSRTENGTSATTAAETAATSPAATEGASHV